MIRLPHRPAAAPLTLAAATLLALPVPLAAQQSFELPPASPSPTPAPAGPADERAGVAIPPRAAPSEAPASTATPVIQPLPSPSASRTPLRLPTSAASPRTGTAAPAPAPATGPTNAATAAPTPAAPAPGTPEAAGPSILAGAPPLASAPAADAATDEALAALPAWWPYAAGGLGALVLLGGGLALLRRRNPKTLRLAAPATGAAPAERPAPAAPEPPRLDMVLEIVSATRSVMMFTLEYRLTIANRSGQAVNDARVAVQLACARASTSHGAGNAPSAGAAQSLAETGRIGPHQSKSISGTVQLPLSAIAPLRQGQTPLFIPLAHVTLEAETVPAQAKSFVIGTPSAAGRVHPIALDVPPGTIAGLVAQAVAIPPVGAAA